MDNGGFPDLSGMIGGILSNPEALKGLMSMAAGLKNTGIFDGLGTISLEKKQMQEEEYSPDGKTYTENKKDEGRGGYQHEPHEGAGTQSEDGQTTNRSAPPLFALPQPKKADGEGDRRRDLLLALRPYLCKERRERLDGILKILGLLEMAKQLGTALNAGGEWEGSR